MSLSNVPAHRRSVAPIVQLDQLVRQSVIQFVTQIFVPGVPAGGSKMIPEYEMYMATMEIFERNQELQDAILFYLLDPN